MTKKNRTACPGTGGPRGEAADSRLRPLGERLARMLTARSRAGGIPRVYVPCSELRVALSEPGAEADGALIEVDLLSLRTSFVSVPAIENRLRAADELERAVLEDEEQEHVVVEDEEQEEG